MHHTAPGTDRQARVRALTSAHLAERGPLMPVLGALVDEFGWIERADVETVADVLNLSVAEVHGVVSFYHDFRTTPPAAHHVALCRAEACQAVGGADLHRQVEGALAARDDVDLTDVYCLGNCALGPAGTVDGRLLGRLTAERVTGALA